MGFPDSFRIPVSDTQAYRQFGNSVVVPVVEAIAKAMVACLSGNPLPPGPDPHQLVLPGLREEQDAEQVDHQKPRKKISHTKTPKKTRTNKKSCKRNQHQTVPA